MADFVSEGKLTCEKMIFGGLGLCRTAAGVVFVSGLLPGETALCRYLRTQGGIPVYESVVPVEHPSDHRVAPFCPYFGVCGGCDWQHIHPAAQARFKKDIFEDLLRRVGGCNTFPEIEVITGPDRHYRMRCQLNLSPQGEGMGFYQKQSRQVVQITSCPLLTPSLSQLLEHQGAILQRITNPPRRVMCLDTGRAVLSSPPLANWSSASGSLFTDAGEVELRGTDFFQGNRYLYSALAQWKADSLGGNSLLDLFGGTGLFALHHGHRYDKVCLVESSKTMARRAQENMYRAGIHHGQACGMSAERFFSTAQRGEYSTVIVDPPRPGLSRTVRQGLIRLAPEHILYVSCNPSTQVRDVRFLRSRGYELTACAFFDMYPHTAHLETAVVLKRG
ncbi:class I SAM-dependent RNA methyltransferase [Chitinivibrio alkaliphilus]|uniref:23S rRNA (Uracil-5-)-methyltransferase RumA n=1 Tax=Chitinivibrio alkaliphilus ACht1 TaxID=1313304 RepID=U7D7E9_9BACT|nr:RsmD family RNA methyltransferase [Chitinivibrio alkaliphilus]ERP31853.1 23S rRNA (uracil-5-)-methyltransferase RumA [Chitinivibrio alkaliphilus ACht1]